MGHKEKRFYKGLEEGITGPGRAYLRTQEGSQRKGWRQRKKAPSFPSRKKIPEALTPKEKG